MKRFFSKDEAIEWPRITSAQRKGQQSDFPGETKTEVHAMRLKEKLLLSLSRESGSGDFQTATEEWTVESALSILCRVFPDFIGSIAGKNILDFGCGLGFQVVALARNGANYVLGVDTHTRSLRKAMDLAQSLGLESRVEFVDKLPGNMQGKFDVVISQNSMEHFPDPVRVLEEMKSAVKEDGAIFITFGPPWYSPRGSHMQFFTKIPWVNILFDERTVMNVRAHFRSDGAIRYGEVESGLNKMTVRGFEEIIANSGLSLKYRKYECVKGLDFLGKIPWLRELFVNHISCVLSKQKYRPMHPSAEQVTYPMSNQCAAS